MILVFFLDLMEYGKLINLTELMTLQTCLKLWWANFIQTCWNEFNLNTDLRNQFLETT